MTETEQIARLLAMLPEGVCGVTASTRTLIAHVTQLRDALQNLLDELTEAEEDRNPETGQLYATVRVAYAALEAANGLNPGALLPVINDNLPEPAPPTDDLASN